jgi:hypothetical protein
MYGRPLASSSVFALRLIDQCCTSGLNITRHTRLPQKKLDWLSWKLLVEKRCPLYIDTDGAKHGHGPEPSEDARYECDCDFQEREALLGEATRWDA